MFQVIELESGYGDLQIIKDISFDVEAGELVSIIGANGAGKTTLINTISGFIKPTHGKIVLNGERIDGLKASTIVEKGVVQVPEGRLLFPKMTVLENLEMGGYLVKDKNEFNKHLELVYTLFPILKEREKQEAGTFSGGEQQMLAIGRALMYSPKLIIFDEPSLGLAPLMVNKVMEAVDYVNKTLGITVILVEQNVKASCEISDRAVVMENGEIVLRGNGQEILQNPHVQKAYLGL